MPRPVIAGEKRYLNKIIVEQLADRLYSMELEGASTHRIWAYRKAAWAVEDLEQDIGLIYCSLGLKGLETIPNIGTPLAKESSSSSELIKTSKLFWQLIQLNQHPIGALGVDECVQSAIITHFRLVIDKLDPLGLKLIQEYLKTIHLKA